MPKKPSEGSKKDSPSVHRTRTFSLTSSHSNHETDLKQEIEGLKQEIEGLKTLNRKLYKEKADIERKATQELRTKKYEYAQLELETTAKIDQLKKSCKIFSYDNEQLKRKNIELLQKHKQDTDKIEFLTQALQQSNTMPKKTEEILKLMIKSAAAKQESQRLEAELQSQLTQFTINQKNIEKTITTSSSSRFTTTVKRTGSTEARSNRSQERKTKPAGPLKTQQPQNISSIQIPTQQNAIKHPGPRSSQTQFNTKPQITKHPHSAMTTKPKFTITTISLEKNSATATQPDTPITTPKSPATQPHNPSSSKKIVISEL